MLSRLAVDLLELFWAVGGAAIDKALGQFGDLGTCSPCWSAGGVPGFQGRPACQPRLESQDLALGDTGRLAGWNGGPRRGARSKCSLQRCYKTGCLIISALSNVGKQVGRPSSLAARGMEAHLILDFDDHSKDECDVGLRVPVLADPASPGDSGPRHGDQFLPLSPSYSRMSLIRSGPRSQVPHS